MIELKVKFEKVEQLTNKQKVIFSTADQIPELERLQNIKAEGYLLFNPDELRANVKAIIKDRKLGVNDLGQTPSERLRKTLFLVAESKGLALQFDDFYREEMDRIINHYQSKYL